MSSTASIFRRVITFFVLLPLVGCSRFFFHPDSYRRPLPESIENRLEEFRFRSGDGTSLVGWHLRSSGDCRGAVMQFHGNAQNMSTHIRSVYWLADAGYDVFLFDYRGYGASEGSPYLVGVNNDALAAVDYFLLAERFCEGKRIVLGQSLGGALSLNAVARSSNKALVDGIILDSAFSSYREAFRDVLSNAPILSWFRYPLSILVPERFSPIFFARRIRDIPVLIVHGTEDNIVRPHHAKRLQEMLGSRAELWLIPGVGHIGAFSRENVRDRLLSFLKTN